MTDHDDPEHRAYHHPDAERVVLREEVGDDDGTFTVRMPLASTGEVRNKGDDPLTEDELTGMAQQVEERAVGVFLDHGSNMDIGGSRYSATGKVGEWTDPETVEANGETLLEADARLMDPETLPAAAGSVREALAALKSQVERDMALSSSIGWREDESMPGGNDLMEASIVGIPADPRTTSQDAPAALARAVVMGPDAEDHRHLSGQQADVAETLLDAYRAEQGNGSVENFESWLWNVAYYQFDENEFHATQTTLQEFYRDTTPLEEPVDAQFIPFLDAQQSASGDESDGEGDDDDTNQSMSDDDPSSDGDGADPDGTNDGQDGMDAQEYRESMLEMQQTQTETLNTLSEALREDDEDDEDDDDDDEQAADIPDGIRNLMDAEDPDVDDVREYVNGLRDDLEDAEPATPDGEQDGDEPDDDQSADPKELL